MRTGSHFGRFFFKYQLLLTVSKLENKCVHKHTWWCEKANLVTTMRKGVWEGTREARTRREFLLRGLIASTLGRPSIRKKLRLRAKRGGESGEPGRHPPLSPHLNSRSFRWDTITLHLGHSKKADGYKKIHLSEVLCLMVCRLFF